MEEYKLKGGERKTTKDKRKGWGEKGLWKRRVGGKKREGGRGMREREKQT